MKVIRVQDGDFVWEFDASLIANHRAIYYYDEDGTSSYKEKYDYTINNNYELIDWFINNMSWSQVSKFARIIEQPFKIRPSPETWELEVVEKKDR